MKRTMITQTKFYIYSKNRNNPHVENCAQIPENVAIVL